MPNAIITYLVNNISDLLPPTRIFKIKALFYRLAGYDIDKSCRLVSSVKIWGNASISVGRETFIGHESMIIGGDSKICIGNNVDIAPRVTIVAGSHTIDMYGDRSAGECYSKDISIGDGAWIGANVTIIGGITVGEKSVIGAGSIVTIDIPPNVVAAGNPCRPIKSWDPQTGWNRIK